MARDPLAILLAVRRFAVDQQQQALALRRKHESEAMACINAIDDLMARDEAVQHASAEAIYFMDMRMSRRQHLQAHRRTAVAALAEASKLTDDALRQLVEARLQAESVKGLLDQKRAATRAEQERSAQLILDDVAGSRRG